MATLSLRNNIGNYYAGSGQQCGMRKEKSGKEMMTREKKKDWGENSRGDTFLHHVQYN